MFFTQPPHASTIPPWSALRTISRTRAASQESFGQMYQYPIRDTGYNGK